VVFRPADWAPPLKGTAYNRTSGTAYNRTSETVATNAAFGLQASGFGPNHAWRARARLRPLA
jgi:hypothetical protein